MNRRDVLVIMFVVLVLGGLVAYNIWSNHDIASRRLNYKQTAIDTCRKTHDPKDWFYCDN